MGSTQHEDNAMTETGRKDDSGKLQWFLLPLEPLREIVRVMQWAAYDKKPKPYGPNNWQHVQGAEQRYYDAAMRHLTEWWERFEAGDADRTDHESKLHILAHVGCCVLFLLWFELKRATSPARPVRKCSCPPCQRASLPSSSCCGPCLAEPPSALGGCSACARTTAHV